jgi:magnesium-protoporphyrin O-methyltransferase
LACKQCQGIEEFFDQKEADKDLATYRKKGPAATTMMLVDAIVSQGVDGGSLLDIGGGIGAIQNELLKAGIKTAVSVDASTAYARVAEQEAERQGHTDRISRHHGDFVDAVSNLEDADVVTLDRVICCYHDVQKLVGLSSQKAKRLYAVVFPRENLLSKLGFGLFNMFFRLRRSPFRIFIHPTSVIEALVEANGLQRQYYHKTRLWQVIVYTRAQ